MKSRLQLTGITLSPSQYAEFHDKQPKLAWVEIDSNDFLGEGGKSFHLIEKIGQNYPLSLSNLNLSIGSTDELNWQQLKKIKELKTRLNPCLLSDRLSWSSFNGHYVHDALPLPYTEECLQHLISRIQQVQEFLQTKILIENTTNYVRFNCSTIPEWEFLQTIAQQTGCGILFDVTSAYINSIIFNDTPQKYLSTLSADSVQEIHLSGFTSTFLTDKEVIIDSHNRSIVPAIWEWYRDLIKKWGTKPTIIEWRTDLPSLETLSLEAYRAEQLMREEYAAIKFAS